MFENSSFAVNGSYNHINHVLGIINRHNRTQENRNLTIINETLTQALANSRKSGQSSAYLAYRIDDVLNTADSYQRTYGVKVAFTYTALVCGTTVVYLLSLVPSRICACVYKAIVPAKVVAVTVVWVVAGVVFLLGLLTSDFCWDPNRNVLKLLKSDPSHSTAYKTVAYFTNCSRSENLTLTDGMCTVYSIDLDTLLYFLVVEITSYVLDMLDRNSIFAEPDKIGGQPITTLLTRNGSQWLAHRI